MTYIEFFDKAASENIGACLTYAPARVIFIGDNSKLMKKHIARYEKVFADRGEKIEFLYRTVPKTDLGKAVDLLSEIVKTYENCMFDITGGEEMLVLALGIVYARYPEKNIQIHRLNLKNGVLYDCDQDGHTIYRDKPAMTVRENVRIYGGDIEYGSVWEDKTYQWDLNEQFCADVKSMWEICRQNVRSWNVQIGIFAAAEAVGVQSEDGLITVVKLSELESYLIHHRGRLQSCRDIIRGLLKAGLLTHYEDSDEAMMAIAYKNLQVKRCLTKAGQALEMIIYTTAAGLREKDGTPVYYDCQNGVVIDWDGDSDTEPDFYETRNEIDILLMHDMVPVFISCKNGTVTVDELYKLNAVAQRFGGRYAKKVLVATALDSMMDGGVHIRQRAYDMGIVLVDDAQKLDDAALARKLKHIWSASV